MGLVEREFSQEDLIQIFNKLIELESLFINEVKIFIQIGGEKGHLHTMDLYTSAVINRAISLMKGFVTLSKDNNYISSIPLIRIQLDNCIRFYAATLVSDYNEFFLNYLKGIHIRNLKDVSGKKMTDSYLISKLDKLFPGIQKLYNNTSGYIHLSNEHSNLQTTLSKTETREINTLIGHYDFYSLNQKVDFGFNMFKASEILLDLTRSWKFQKQKVEKGIKS